MEQKIVSVEAGSIAEQLGILPGDILVSINGERILDRIDYQALSSEEDITLVVSRGGEEIEFRFQKDDWEPLGLGFETLLMADMRSCANKCIFCFEEQLPGTARPSLHSKDDDWRLSIMTGSFVTLTNTGKTEMDRIIRRRASPLYVSVHATDAETRVKLLGCPSAGDIMAKLDYLKKGGIEYHTQAVLCPGINDGDTLEKTICDLAHLYPAAKSLALVPVGLTKFRDGSDGLRLYTKDEARAILKTAEKWQKLCLKSYGTRFVYPADEFYVIAETDPPSDEDYDDFNQIDNGIGMISLFRSEFESAYRFLEPSDKKKNGKKKIAIACGHAIAPIFKKLFAERPFTGLDISVLAVDNRFFGETVTVSGLLTGSDLIAALKDSDAEAVLFTCTAMREGEEVFLDDSTLDEVKTALGRPVIPVGRGGDELVDALLELR